MRTASTRSWREQRQTASKWMTEHHRVRKHSINRTPPNARNPAVKPAHGLVPHMVDKQTHPLMRRIQNTRIVPGQPPQILAIHAELLRSLNDVAKVLAQSARRSLVADMRKRCRPFRNERHGGPAMVTDSYNLDLIWAIGRLGGLKIRLVTWIDNCFSFPRRSAPEPHETRIRAALASSRERRSIVPHNTGLSRNDCLLSNMARKLRDPKLGTLPDAHRLATEPHAAPGAAASTDHRSLEQAQHSHRVAAARRDKQRPPAAAGKSPHLHPDGLLDAAEFDHELGRFGCDDADRP